MSFYHTLNFYANIVCKDKFFSGNSKKNIAKNLQI